MALYASISRTSGMVAKAAKALVVDATDRPTSDDADAFLRQFVVYRSWYLDNAGVMY
jgi:hypothetical protein